MSVYNAEQRFRICMDKEGEEGQSLTGATRSVSSRLVIGVSSLSS